MRLGGWDLSQGLKDIRNEVPGVLGTMVYSSQERSSSARSLLARRTAGQTNGLGMGREMEDEVVPGQGRVRSVRLLWKMGTPGDDGAEERQERKC